MQNEQGQTNCGSSHGYADIGPQKMPASVARINAQVKAAHIALVCGLVCDGGGLVQDREGCILRRGHEGPHEFINELDGWVYQWEYDLVADCDVFWASRFFQA